MPAPILHVGLWPTVDHLVNTNATRGDCTGDRSAIFPQWMTYKYDMGSWLAHTLFKCFDL